MTTELFKVGLADLYQRETAGEVALTRLLEKYDTPRLQYALGSILQLETETKARLRPAVLALGISMVEMQAYRDQGDELGHAIEGLSWEQAVPLLAAAMAGYVREYREIAKTAPPEYQALADSMVAHEESIERFFVMEAAGEHEHAIDSVVAQLVYPLPKPA